MKISFLRWAGAFTATATIVAACSSSDGPAPIETPAGVSSAAHSRAVVEATAAVFPALRHVPAAGRARVHVALPQRAGEPVSIVDERSGLGVTVQLEGARPAGLSMGVDLGLYEDALGDGAHVLERVLPHGVEDFVVLPRPARVRYRIDVSRAAGLRLVGEVLEILDGDGTPRLHVSPPYVVDAHGVRRGAHLRIEGCAFDADPRGPWGRAPTPPGGSWCGLEVAFSDEGLAYPILVDPAWTSAQSLAQGRFDFTVHTVTAGAAKRILVAGGAVDDVTHLASCELYDPGSDSWSPTGSLATRRRLHGAAVLPDGKVFVAGGYSDVAPNTLGSAEIYDPTAGTWSTVPVTMVTPRWWTTATLLGDGTVLVAGGFSGSGPTPTYLPSCEIYTPRTKSWSATGDLNDVRGGHTATLVPGVGVLVIGGGMVGGESDTVELYAGGTWTLKQKMKQSRRGHVALLMPDKAHVFVGGGQAEVRPEIFDVANNAWAEMDLWAEQRLLPAGALLPSGDVLLAGGYDKQDGLLFDPLAPAGSQWHRIGNLSVVHQEGRAVVLDNGTVLVIGGYVFGGPATAAVDVLTLDPAGTPCKYPSDCATGFCVDGVCCDSACHAGAPDQSCYACSKSAGAMQDGACHPLTKSTCADAGAGTGTGGHDAGDGGPPGSETRSFLSCAARAPSRGPAPAHAIAVVMLALAAGARRARGSSGSRRAA